MSNGFNCPRRGHLPMDGWDDHTPQRNTAGHLFLPRVCRKCHCAYIEFIREDQVGRVLTEDGRVHILDGEEG